ncbi:MAG: DUF2334 domain-containing protein [Chloroflexota bacterium]
MTEGVGRRLVVSLHDVAPPFEPAIRRQISLLRDVGASRLVLKVVPNWHGQYPIDQHPSLVELLQSEAEAGSQLVLHGYRHMRSGPLRGSIVQQVRGRVFAGDAAEFLSLHAGDAAQAIDEGLRLFERAGLPRPDTFCPPGWLMTGDLEVEVRRASLRFSIGMMQWSDGRRHSLPSIGYMGSSEFGVRLLNGLVTLVVPRSRAVKIYLHPQGDASGQDRIIARVAGLIQAGWETVTYEGLRG